MTNKGDVDIFPDEINAIIKKYNIQISKKKDKEEKDKRDVIMLIIAKKTNVDIFVHYNPKHFLRSPQMKKLITNEINKVKILQLAEAIQEIKRLRG